ncbi:MAG: NlpC/P60 family protein [Lawsonella sp.]
MGTHNKTDNKKKLLNTGRALVGVGVTGAVAFTGVGVGGATPHTDLHKTHAGGGVDANDLLRQLGRANEDLRTLNAQLAQDRERANKALVDLQNARENAASARDQAKLAAEDLDKAHRQLMAAQEELNAIAANAYRTAATSNTAVDLMSGEDPDAVVAREALLARTAAQQSAVVDSLKQARAANANKAAEARAKEAAAETARQVAINYNRDANDILLAATTAVRSKEKEIARIEQQRAEIAVSLQTVQTDTDGGGSINIDRQAVIEALVLTGDFARAAAAADVDLNEIETVEDLAQLPLEVLQAIPPELWERLGLQVRRQIAKKSPEAANVLGVATEVHKGNLPHTALVTANVQLLKSVPNAIRARQAEQEQYIIPEDSSGDGYYQSSDQTVSRDRPSLAARLLSSRAQIEKVIRRGMSQLGVPYAWGGGNIYGPTRGIRDGGVADSYGDYNKIGFDCSGLMVYAFAAVGFNLPHYSGYQYTSGTQIPVALMKRGDMLFYGPGGSQHVALYLGDGMMLEAPQSGDVVKVSPVRWEGMTPMAVRMIL